MRGIGALLPRLSGWGPTWARARTLNCYVKPIECWVRNRYLFREVLHVHSAHATRRATMAVLLFLRSLGHHDLGGEQQPRHRRRVLQCQARHLGRVEDTFLEHVAE